MTSRTDYNVTVYGRMNARTDWYHTDPSDSRTPLTGYSDFPNGENCHSRRTVSKVGNSIPGFKAKVKFNLPPNAFSFNRYEIQRVSGICNRVIEPVGSTATDRYVYSGNLFLIGNGTWSTMMDPSVICTSNWPALQNLDSLAIKRFMDSAREGSAQSLMIAKDFGTNAKMIGDSAVKIRKVLQGIITRKPKLIADVFFSHNESSRHKIDSRKSENFLRRLIKSTKPSQDLWLEAQFGWLPMLRDIDDSCAAIANLQFNPVSLRITGSAKQTFKVQEKLQIGIPAENLYTHGVRTVTRRVKYVCHFAPPSTTVSVVKTLQLDNVLGTVWDVIPGSFVVDWITPIGAWLSSLTALSGLDFLNGTKTSSSEEECICRIRGGGSRVLNGTSQYQTFVGSGSGFEKKFSLNRSVLLAPPSMKFPLKFDISNNVVTNTRHAIDALALTFQRMK